MEPRTCTTDISNEVSKFYWDIIAKYSSNIDVGCALDLGCGRGGLGKSAPASFELFGVDRDCIALQHAAKYFQHTLEIDLEKKPLPFAEKKFNVVFARDILEHLHYPWILVGEIHRVLKSDGIVIASVPMAKPRVVWNDYTHIRGFTKKAITNLFLHNNFVVEDVYHVGGYLLSTKLGLTKYLRTIMRIPFTSHLAVSYQVICRKCQI